MRISIYAIKYITSEAANLGTLAIRVTSNYNVKYSPDHDVFGPTAPNHRWYTSGTSGRQLDLILFADFYPRVSATNSHITHAIKEGKTC